MANHASKMCDLLIPETDCVCAVFVRIEVRAYVKRFVLVLVMSHVKAFVIPMKTTADL